MVKLLGMGVALVSILVGLGLRAGDYARVITDTAGLVAYFRFEEVVDPRLEFDKEEHPAVDEKALRGLFFPGGSSLKLSVRLRDEVGDFYGRTEEVRTGEMGIFGKAFRFNGKDSRVYVFRDPRLESGVGDFSLELWIKPDDTDASYMLLQRQSPFAKGNGGIFLQMGSGGTLSFSIVERQHRSIAVSAPKGTLSPKQWQHIVAIRRGATLSLFINGRLLKAQTGPPGLRIPDYGDIIIGGTAWDRLFRGLIDEVAFYNKALSPREIESHFAKGSR